MKAIRAMPIKSAPCNKRAECKDRICRNPHCCEEWREYANKELKR